MWNLFDKLGSSNNHKHKDSGDNGGLEKQAEFTIDEHSQFPSYTPFQNSHWVPHMFMEEGNFQPRMKTPESQIYETMRRVHMDVLDFQGKNKSIYISRLAHFIRGLLRMVLHNSRSSCMLHQKETEGLSTTMVAKLWWAFKQSSLTSHHILGRDEAETSREISFHRLWRGALWEITITKPKQHNGWWLHQQISWIEYMEPRNRDWVSNYYPL